MPSQDVRLYLRHTSVLCQNDQTHYPTFFTIGSHTILVCHTERYGNIPGRDLPNGGDEYMEYEKLASFD